MTPSILKHYPQYKTLRGIVPDDVIERVVGLRAKEFETYLKQAKKSIPVVNINNIFPSELEKGSIHLENFLGHWGNVSIEEVCKMALIVKFIKPKRILEIGTYNGMTTLQLALNAPKECITYTLDLPNDTKSTFSLSEIDTYVNRHFRKKFGTTTGSYFKGRKNLKIKQLLGDSATFDYSVLGGPVDVIFIDAAHDYKNKKIDTENAFNLLAKGGVILWHNYNDVGSPDITKYLCEISNKYKIFNLRNTYLAVYWDAYKSK